MKRLLDGIQTPKDLKSLSCAELSCLAEEIRAEIIATTSHTGGHVASSLGAVEIILAVHSMIDAPKDKFIFDVGHQSYAHKLVTGRLKDFPTLRSTGGISGFTKPSESEYDVHSSGHASDSLSIALGIGMGEKDCHEKSKIVALIGDAAMSGGMAFEAMNTIGQMKLPIVVILNDNEMSISRNVGALGKHFGSIRASAGYRQARLQSKEFRDKSGLIGKAFYNFGRNAKESLKQFIIPESMIFENMGFICTPPIDGHNIEELKTFLQIAFDAKSPVLIHAVTHKGEGYDFAEKEPERFHGIGSYDPATGKSIKKKSNKKTFTQVFSSSLVKEAKQDDSIYAITAGMELGTGLHEFARQFPNRFIDVGISEENAVGLAAGLAIEGRKPVVAIYSTFLQRAIDQMIVNVALDELPVVFAIDRAGIVGQDGPTHHGLYDISYCRMIPHMSIAAPSNEAELDAMLHFALRMEGPCAIRYPRGEGFGAKVPEEPLQIELGKSQTIRMGDDVAILSFGDRLEASLQAADMLEEKGIGVEVVDMRWIAPLDFAAIDIASQKKLIVTVENGIIAGGAGEGVLSYLAQSHKMLPLLNIGIDNKVVESGKTDDLLHKYGLDAQGIAQSIEQYLASL